uniref:Uncharacterized protein n=1 Tax=Hucho hucho TaxID=62062 RepID=A0A4W5L040_9TELE
MADVEGERINSVASPLVQPSSRNGSGVSPTQGTGSCQTVTTVTSGPRLVRIVKSDSGYGFNVRGQSYRECTGQKSRFIPMKRLSV